MSWVVVVVGVAMLLGGLAMSYQGYNRWEIAQRIADTPTTPAGDLDSTGPVELEGTVVPKESMDSPIAQRENTVLAAWEVEQYHEDDDSSGWQNEGVGITSKPFYVEDESGRALVDLHGDVSGDGELLYGSEMLADVAGEGLHLDNIIAEFESFDIAAEIPVDEPTPDHITEFCTYQPNIFQPPEGGSGLVDMGNADGDRRYYEATLAAGDTVYLLGEAVAREGASEPLDTEDIVVEPPADPQQRFILSDMGEDGLLSRKKRGRYRLAGGAVLAIVGVLAVLSGAAALL